MDNFTQKSSSNISDDMNELIKFLKEKIPCNDENSKYSFTFAVSSSRVEELKTALEKIKDDINIDITFYDSELVDENKVYVLPGKSFQTDEYQDHLDNVEVALREFSEDEYFDREEICDEDDRYRCGLTEIELRRKIKYTKNPLEKQRLERELGYMNSFGRHKSATKKRKNKRRKK